MLVRTETELETTSCSAVQDSWLRNARVQALPSTEWKTAENDTSTQIHKVRQATQIDLSGRNDSGGTHARAFSSEIAIALNETLRYNGSMDSFRLIGDPGFHRRNRPGGSFS
jgi:hypothetical protein